MESDRPSEQSRWLRVLPRPTNEARSIHSAALIRFRSYSANGLTHCSADPLYPAANPSAMIRLPASLLIALSDRLFSQLQLLESPHNNRARDVTRRGCGWQKKGGAAGGQAANSFIKGNPPIYPIRPSLPLRPPPSIILSAAAVASPLFPACLPG